MRNGLHRMLPVVLVVFGLVAPARAQTLYALDRANRFVYEWTGIDDPCLVPFSGPIQSLIPTVAGAVCPGLGPIPSGLGDVAVDPIEDVVYVTDGRTIAGYLAGEEAFLASVTSPLPNLTGLGIDASGRLLWITDGTRYGALALPLGSCDAVPALALGPLNVPIGTIFGGLLGDLDWDAASGALFGCDATGRVGSFFVGSDIGPYAVYQAAPGTCAQLAPPLVGLTIDRARSGTGIVYVTDGVDVARLAPGGALAPATFDAPDSCYVSPASLSMTGLGFAGRLVEASPFGVSVELRSIGQSWSGNPGYTLTLRNAPMGSAALLQYSYGSLCPWISFRRGALYYLAAPRSTAALLTVSSTTASVTMAIPPTVPPGLTFFVQWVVLRPDGRVVTSEAGIVTTIRP